DFLDRPAPTLRPATACRDDESLTERMRMPRSPRTRLESDAGALNQCWIGRLKERIDTYRTGEPLCRSLDRRLRANSLDVHFQYSCLVGLNRISLTSTFSGWLMANTTISAKESAGIAIS